MGEEESQVRLLVRQLLPVIMDYHVNRLTAAQLCEQLEAHCHCAIKATVAEERQRRSGDRRSQESGNDNDLQPGGPAKLCKACKILKPLGEFSGNASNKADGHCLYCKVCERKRVKEYAKRKKCAA